jgi:hypothetical protein
MKVKPHDGKPISNSEDADHSFTTTEMKVEHSGVTDDRSTSERVLRDRTHRVSFTGLLSLQGGNDGEDDDHDEDIEGDFQAEEGEDECEYDEL